MAYAVRAAGPDCAKVVPAIATTCLASGRATTAGAIAHSQWVQWRACFHQRDLVSATKAPPMGATGHPTSRIRSLFGQVKENRTG